MSEQLEKLYQEARSALKEKDYIRAGGLLRQILQIDENYKDASRLLAQVVKLRRRRWYNHPVLWTVAGVATVIALGIWLAPKISLPANQLPTSTVISPTITSSPTALPATATQTATEPPLPTPTVVPLKWKRISLGQDVRRDAITAIVVDPRDQDVIYVGMEHSGIYKSIDGGLSWFPSHNGLERAQVKEMLIDANNPNILVVHTFPDQVYRTIDGGRSWNVVLDNLENYNSQDYYYMASFSRRLIRNLHDNQRLLLTDRNGWYESQNSGQTWVYQENNWGSCPSLLGAVGFHATDPDTIFLSQMGDDGNCKNGIYRWNSSSNTLPEPVFQYERHGGADPVHTSVIVDIQTTLPVEGSSYLYVRSENGEVYTSTDNGSTWRGNETVIGFTGLFRCPAFTTRLDGQALGFCYTRSSGKVMTTYGGENWKEMVNIPSFVAEDWTSSGPAIFAISYFPSQPDTAILGGHGVFITFDNGATWSEMSNGLPAISMDIQYSLATSSLFLTEHTGCIGSEALLQSMDNGRNWDLLERQACGFAIDSEGITMYRIAGNTFLMSRDGGLSWAAGARPTINDSQIVSIAAHPKQPGEASSKIKVGITTSNTSSDFFTSSDRGFTWHNQGSISENSSLEDGIFYALDSDKTIYSVGSQSNVVRLAQGDDKKLTPCAILDVPSPNSATIMAIHPDNANKIYLTTLGKGVQFSENGCQSWTSLNTGLESLFVNSIALDPKDPNILYTGTDGGAYVSFDSGTTWNQINEGLLGATVVYSIVVDKDGNVYAATPYGIFKLEGK